MHACETNFSVYDADIRPSDWNRASLSESFWLQNGGKMDAKSARGVRFAL